MEREMTDEIDTYADVQALEEKFINAGDVARAEMLASGEAPATDRLIYLGQQSLARIALGRPLEGK